MRAERSLMRAFGKRAAEQGVELDGASAPRVNAVPFG
jgi:hypothetical protein